MKTNAPNTLSKERTLDLVDKAIRRSERWIVDAQDRKDESDQIFYQGQLKVATEFKDIVSKKVSPLAKDEVSILMDKLSERSQRWIEDAENRHDESDQIFYQGQKKLVQEMKELLINC